MSRLRLVCQLMSAPLRFPGEARELVWVPALVMGLSECGLHRGGEVIRALLS